MIVSIVVLKKDGKMVVIIGDHGNDDDKKENTCNAQLLTCVEGFKAWAEGKTRVQVIIPIRPDALSEKPKIDKRELSKLIYRVPLWINKEDSNVTLSCVDTRAYKGTELVADVRSLLDREEVLDQWIEGSVKIHNLSRSTWAEYLKSARDFIEDKKKTKKQPLIVKGLIEVMEERTQDEYVRSHKVFGERKLSMQRKVLHHSFRRCRPLHEVWEEEKEEGPDHMFGDILFIKAIHSALIANPKVLFLGKQSHANTISQYLVRGIGYEEVFKVEHMSDNRPVDIQDIRKALEALLKKKKKKKKKNKQKKGEQGAADDVGAVPATTDLAANAVTIENGSNTGQEQGSSTSNQQENIDESGERKKQQEVTAAQ
eukprot:jgi/Bigna1/91424/estExt_fgenesh1_pg.C_1000039